MENRCHWDGCDYAAEVHQPFCSWHILQHFGHRKIGAEVDAQVAKLVMEMPDDLREVILLYFFHWFSIEQMRDILALPEDVIKRRLLDAVDKFAVDLQGISLFSATGAPPSAEGIAMVAVEECDRELTKFASHHPEIMMRVSPRDFERIVAEILRAFQFEVELTAQTRDGGCDIIACQLDRLGIRTKYLVECKRYAPDNKVGVQVVRAAYGVRGPHRADHVIVATTSSFTKDAIAYSKHPSILNLHLKDGQGLRKWCDQYRDALLAGGKIL